MLKKIIHAILREWKFFIFIAVLLYGIYLINFNIDKNMNKLIREISANSLNIEIYDVIQELKELESIAKDLSDISFKLAGF